jgi:hypothetical protein
MRLKNGLQTSNKVNMRKWLHLIIINLVLDLLIIKNNMN